MIDNPPGKTLIVQPLVARSKGARIAVALEGEEGKSDVNLGAN